MELEEVTVPGMFICAVLRYQVECGAGWWLDLLWWTRHQ
jgi:hypothetical protein